VDIFFLQLGLIFVPGIIWERIDAKYGRDRATQQWDILRRTFVFGIVAYVVTSSVCWIISFWATDWAFKFFDFKKDAAFLDATAFREILAASGISLICSILWLYATNRKWIGQILQAIGATKRYGDEDVWDYMFNSGRPEVEYVHVRDFEKKLAYSGWVEVWSESEKTRELVLRDVIVSDFEGTELFKTPRVYLARKPDNIDIEFPYTVQEGEKNGESTQ
jgi:hypothetical protein